MLKYEKDKDLVSLGRTLARLVTTTENSISEGLMNSDSKGGDSPPKPRATGSPLILWTDVLDACADSLRQTGIDRDLDLADILELKHLDLGNETLATLYLAQRAIARLFAASARSLRHRSSRHHLG